MKWLSSNETGETAIIELVCELLNAEKLSALSRCEMCKRWLVKTKADRKFCTQNCRSNFYAQTDKGKLYHGNKAREQHERKRQPTLEKVRKVLKEWARKPLKANTDWKAKMGLRVADVSRAFLTRAIRKGEIASPKYL